MSRNKTAGVDEAGRGALAGPIIAGAVILNTACPIKGLKDSKKLTPNRREVLFNEIKVKSEAWSAAVVGNEEIDRLGIQKANLIALERAVGILSVIPDIVVADWYKNDGFPIRWLGVVRGEDMYEEIAAASIVAKVTRDRLMRELAEEYPKYGFEKNKGYGSPGHISAIKRLGICPVHRISFSPCRAKLL